MISRLAQTTVLLLPIAWCPALAAQTPPTEPPPELVELTQDPIPELDRIELKNGDVVTGTVKSMGKGKIKLSHPLLGDMEIKFDDIANMVTKEPVTMKTKDGEILKRRILGIENDELQLASEPGQATTGGLPRGELKSINAPPPDWTGSISLGMNLSSGNTDKRNIAANADVSRRSENDRIKAKGYWLYESDKTAGQWRIIDRILRGSFQYDYFFTDKLYGLVMAAAGSDYSANLDLRFTMGGGLGYQWYETERFKLSTELSPQYFSESFDDPSQDSDRIAARVASRMEWQIIEGLDLVNDVQYFPSLEDKDDMYLIKDTRLRIALTESMFAQAQWILQFDNTPNPGDDRLDNAYLLQVGYSF